jgi:hypothetical protein
MKSEVVVLSASRERQNEKESGFTYPGKIVAAARWRGNKKGSFGTAIPREPKRK